jgi:hypothetical protein
MALILGSAQRISKDGAVILTARIETRHADVTP